jgi:predicted ribosome quality control (RQC) complex YloA/Tae2 family protein
MKSVDIATLRAIQVELENTVVGKRLGRLFPLTRFETAADMHLSDGRWLFFSIEPASPRIYLVRRRLREIEKKSGNPSPFLLLLKKRLSNALLTKISVPEEDRVMLLEFDAEDEMGEREFLSLAIQLTGRSANIFLLDAERNILATARESQGMSQTIGELYAPPQRSVSPTSTVKSEPEAIATGFINDTSISEQLDQQHLEQQSEKQFQQLAQNARSKIASEIKRKEKLQKNLEHDLANHGDADRWKHFGDVLLANIGTARRENDAFLVTDYFDEEQKQIQIPFENNDTPSETAAKYFRRYTKARNAADEIAKRLGETENELNKLRERLLETEEHIADRNIEALESSKSVSGKGGNPTVRNGTSSKSGKHTNDERSGYRTFLSSNGFEILVGKRAKDNDQLTQRVAKSLDTWMHAADYPGSHVVIRDSGKREVPNQTLLEAAQLAAFYSQGRKQVKAAIHYTQKKFVNKPKGSAPGLVSLASFKTLLVEPKIPSGVQLGGGAAGVV